MGHSKELFEQQRQDEIQQYGQLQSVTKSEIDRQVANMYQMVQEGQTSPLKAYAYAKYLREAGSRLEKKVLPDGLEEISKYGGKASMLGIELAEKEAGVRYDFSNTALWVQLKEQEKAIAEQRKELEAQLKTIKKPTEQVVGDTVETLNPPIKTSTTTIEARIPND